MTTIQLESPLEYIDRYVEVGTKLYLVRAISDDRKTLTVTEMADINPDASPHWSASILPSDGTDDNPT